MTTTRERSVGTAVASKNTARAKGRLLSWKLAVGIVGVLLLLVILPVHRRL